MSLDDVVDVQISVESRAPTQAGFGTTLIAGYHTHYVDHVREYAKPGDLLDDGFVATDHIYQMALAIKSQNPSPKTFKVGRLEHAYTHTVTLTPTITTVGFTYQWTIAGHAGSYTVLAGDTVALIVAAIQPLVDAYTEVAATEDSTKLTVTATATGTIVTYVLGKGFAVSDTTTAASIADDLAAIQSEDDDWYGLVTDVNSEASIALVAAWIEATRKVYVPMSSDSGVVDNANTTDVASALVTSAYARSGLIWHPQVGTWANAAWLGQMLTFVPGRATWVNKTLAGIPVSKLTAGNETALKNKHATGYLAIGGINVTNPNGGGRTGSGEFFDTTHLIDWTHARIQESVFGAMANSPKIPYTDSGVDIIRACILAVLNQGIANGGYASSPAPTVTAPKVADVAPADRINRLLPDVEFTAQLAGAIHATVITGTVEV